ncbi:MAG: hypothetical protein H6631_02940 [Anaerolineaceae bacterium]|nr:hypothetical protein [Anaerolineaceae bacterium]MCB9099650.1 hypothetical protein [Anaerolineales bacterium]
MDTHLSTLISKLFFTMLLLITLSLLSLSGAGAQTLQPDKPQLYENETIKIELNLEGVADFEQLAAASFTVNAPVNFEIRIDPGNLFDNLDRDTVDGYIFQVRPNTPALGTFTVSIALAGKPLPQVNVKGTSLATLILTAPSATSPLETNVSVTGLKVFDQKGQPLFSQTAEIILPLTVQPINGVTVMGQVTREQGVGNFVPAQGAAVQLYTSSSMSPVFGTAIQTNDQGRFTVSGGVGEVRLYAPPLSGQRPIPDGYLPAAANLSLTGGPPTPLNGVRRLAGDVVTAGEDNHCPAINLADIVALAQRVGGPPASGGNIFDLNRDGSIDAADLVLAAINFNSEGYINWQSGIPNTSFCTAGQETVQF